ncbi:hypothetical protein Q5752_002511 [Cryptotrichosporon argae]
MGNTDADHDAHVMAGYKAALHNPNTSEAAKQHAREVLNVHPAERVAAGYKAALNNPRVSDEAKEHAREVLESGDFEQAHMKSPKRVEAGLKSAAKNPRVSEEAKESARERLEQMHRHEHHEPHA